MEENQVRPSGIRQPSKLPAPTSSNYGLSEITDSQHNARLTHSTSVHGAQKRSVPAPAVVSDPKRKQLSERAGTEFYGTKSQISTRTGTRVVQANSLANLHRPGASGLPGTRQVPNTNYASTSSYANSVGPGGRPPSRSHIRTRSATRPTRPATAMSSRDEPAAPQGSNVADIGEKMKGIDDQLQKMKEFMLATERATVNTQEELDAAKRKAMSLEDERDSMRSERQMIKDQLEDAERRAKTLVFDLEEEKRRHERCLREMENDHRRAMEAKEEEFVRQMSRIEKLQQEFEERCGADAEARLENLSQDNKELRSTLERQKRDHEHEIRLLEEDVQRRAADLRRVEEVVRQANTEKLELETQIRGNNETIERLRRRAEDAEERLSKDKGHLGGQISLLSSTIDMKSERIQTLEENSKKLQIEAELEIQKAKSAAVKQIADETCELREKLIKEEERRHKLFEQFQELKGNIRVMCRIKPPSNPGKDSLIAFKPQYNEIDEDKIEGLSIPTFRQDPTEPSRMLPDKPKDFNFERVFDEKCTNRDVFDEISQLVQSVMDGKRVCIFCYGQTGSGKTFTMSKREGTGEDDGIIPQTQAMIFGEVERLKTLGWEYTVEGSYLEVYQDKLYDLLASRHSKPEPLTVDSSAEELNIRGHDFTLLHDERDLGIMVQAADSNRHVAATAKNDRSSRSHSILVLKINGVKRDPATGAILKQRKGTLNLIDLAGSEKPDKSRGQQVYDEGVKINSSLSYLRTVLSSLGQGKTEGVDFRSYTLTQLLRPSLGKGCRTLMFVMVSPLRENENETVRSLEFARDAQKVKMGGNGGARSRK
ncbi:P-loop containing nucleoside triphosphate hydrolase protein [Xylariaceae sp. FL0255]|nr:P-loop containing nucleoside triphosphate hydrolase protein [Xylariaceae sp. FL0255]